MDRLKRYRRPIEETLERVVYSCAIHAALAEVEPLPDMRPPALALRLPKGAREEEYFYAANLIALGLEEQRRPLVVSPDRDRKGVLNFDNVSAAIGDGGSTILLIEHDAVLPSTVIAAIDEIIEVRRVSVDDLQTAARDFMSLELTDDEAKQLWALPLDIVLAAMRPGRTFGEIARRAASARSLEVDTPAQPRLEDLGGFGAAAIWGRELIQDVRSWREGAIPWDDIDAGLLLSGPPGTGKTLYASALANSCDLHFVSASIAKWQSYGHLGDLLGAMRATFQEATTKSPSLLFLDEFDSVGDRSRFSHANANYSTQVVNGLLEAIDGSDRRRGVVIVGATNNPDAVDPAFLRPGRLGRHIRIGLPDYDARKAIIRIHLGDDIPNQDVERVAAATDGMTGADLAGIARAVRRKVRVEKLPLDAQTIIACLPTAYRLAGKERRIACIHEAGHAVVGTVIGYGVLEAAVVVKEIRSSTGIAGAAMFAVENRVVRGRQSFLDEICVKLAGFAAEKIAFRGTTSGSGGSDVADLAVAADIATSMVCQLGMGEQLRHFKSTSSAELDRLRRSLPDVDRQVSRILEVELARASSVLSNNWVALEKIAAVLESEGLAEGEEARSLIFE
ncbi:AAA family ATPase [Rhizobium leguminosarum]|uniref:AAA family ATPase n=1 Tax=Rhizobium leguminosarum TaxID=384 RepID=UPI000FEC4351|nr:AAA family ATPase [Rhizobium leguminosarum]RWX40268.1 AAA family ATPase [Rhizobium leguminosarum]